MIVRAPFLFVGLLFAGFPPALAETQIVRPGACAPRPAVVYVVRAPAPAPAVFLAEGGDHIRDSVALFVQTHSRGWASRRLLARFDLVPNPDRTIVVNAGPFCTEGG